MMPFASYDNPWEDDGDDPPFRYPECETAGCTNRVSARRDVYCLDCQQQQRETNDRIVTTYLQKFSKESA